jgi:hypothetical protein
MSIIHKYLHVDYENGFRNFMDKLTSNRVNWLKVKDPKKKFIFCRDKELNKIRKDLCKEL